MADRLGKKNQEDRLKQQRPSVTGRSVRRAEEDRDFVPVIVKRTDETHRHPDDILEWAILEGLEQLKRPFGSLALSAVTAGLILCFVAMSVGVVSAITGSVSSGGAARIATALVYPLGFVLCIMSGTELFTEHTATAVYPVLDRRASIWSMLRLWGTVLAGNLAGAAGGAWLLCRADEVITAREGYLMVGHHLVSFSFGSLFVSALLAGWLMALGAWLILATPPTVSQFLSIYFVTFLIGLGGLHHSIAGTAEILTGYFISDHFTVGQVVRFISIAVAGNLVGGSLFVAVLNYGHIRQSQTIT